MELVRTVDQEVGSRSGLDSYSEADLDRLFEVEYQVE
jgi:hypothetical protein